MAIAWPFRKVRPDTNLGVPLQTDQNILVSEVIQPVWFVDDTDPAEGMSAGPTCRPPFIAVGPSNPGYIMPGQIWDGTIGSRSPLGYIRNVNMTMPSASMHGAAFNGATVPPFYESFGQVLTVVATGDVTSVQILAAAGVGLYWELGSMTVSGALAPVPMDGLTISDGIGNVPLGQTWIGQAQGTSNTAVNISAPAASFVNNSRVAIRFIARRVS